MKKFVALIFLISIIALGEQQAITDNKVEVILKDDSTWFAVDSISGQISPFATTEDTQYVYLKGDGTWEYMEKDNIGVSDSESKQSKQFAITDNGINVLLHKKGEWELVTDYNWMEIEIAPLAYTEDSQRVFLKYDSTKLWYYVSDLDSALEAEYPGQDMKVESLPYYVLKKPKPLSYSIPKYPDEAKKAGIEGTTLVKMLIDTDGSVIDVKVLESSGCLPLDRAALDAAWRSLFTPAIQNGVPVRVWVSRPFMFRLN